MKQILRFVGLVSILLAVSACDNTTAPEHLQRAQAYFDGGEYSTAIIELKNALQKDAELADARFLLGKTHAVLGDYPSAYREFERALDLGVVDDELIVGLLSSKNRLGRYQEVIGELEERGALDPDLAAVLGDAYLAGGDIAKAKPLYQQALTLAAGNRGLGTIAWVQGDLERAEHYLNEAVQIDPQDREGWIRKGEFELSQQAYPAAVQSFTAARDLPGGSLTGKLGLARTYLAEARLPEAETVIAEVLVDSPGLSIAHYLDALIRYQQQDIEGAEAARKSVV